MVRPTSTCLHRSNATSSASSSSSSVRALSITQSFITSSWPRSSTMRKLRMIFLRRWLTIIAIAVRTRERFSSCVRMPPCLTRPPLPAAATGLASSESHTLAWPPGVVPLAALTWAPVATAVGTSSGRALPPLAQATVGAWRTGATPTAPGSGGSSTESPDPRGDGAPKGWMSSYVVRLASEARRCTSGASQGVASEKPMRLLRGRCCPAESDLGSESSATGGRGIAGAERDVDGAAEETVLATQEAIWVARIFFRRASERARRQRRRMSFTPGAES
mmetsp:Transcript_36161/g.92422  ORF Transcript_36161/g.92422 Transcript_36161/m.92422 type:complete len:277 (+) Transcript_36161:534-1364(+)